MLRKLDQLSFIFKRVDTTKSAKEVKLINKDLRKNVLEGQTFPRGRDHSEVSIRLGHVTEDVRAINAEDVRSQIVLQKS